MNRPTTPPPTTDLEGMAPIDGVVLEKPQLTDREDRVLTVLYVVVCIGFIALGVISLCASVPLQDIG